MRLWIAIEVTDKYISRLVLNLSNTTLPTFCITGKLEWTSFPLNVCLRISYNQHFVYFCTVLLSKGRFTPGESGKSKRLPKATVQRLLQGCARFPEFLQNFSERQILWSLCSVVFHALTLKLPIQTSLSVAPKLPVYTHSGEKCSNFSKTSTPLRDCKWVRACVRVCVCVLCAWI